MNDNTIQNDVDAVLDEQKPSPTQPSDKPEAEQDKNALPTQLRKLYESEKKKREEAEAKLAAKQKEEEDKNKSLEEKLAESKKKEEELEKRYKQSQAKYTLERKLLAESVSSEFASLLVEKAQDELAEDGSNIDELVTSLKTQFPSAFTPVDNKPAPIGKVGISANTGGSGVALTKEKVAEMLVDPRQPLTKELDEAARKFGL